MSNGPTIFGLWRQRRHRCSVPPQAIDDPTGPFFKSDTQEQILGHGFRATGRTLIRALPGRDKEVIEPHLAHVSDEELGGSYDRTTHLGQRRKMIKTGLTGGRSCCGKQGWAGALCVLR